jgi:hypothetical protein
LTTSTARCRPGSNRPGERPATYIKKSRKRWKSTWCWAAAGIDHRLAFHPRLAHGSDQRGRDSDIDHHHVRLDPAAGLHAELDDAAGVNTRRGHCHRRRHHCAREHLPLHRREGFGRPLQAAIDATKEISMAVVATTISLVIIFVPIAFMTGLREEAI